MIEIAAQGSLALVLAGALAGGFVLGLTGFGNGLAAYAIWLHVLPPSVAAPLVAIGSVAGHLAMYGGFRHKIIGTRIRPVILGGLIGIPIGTLLLTVISAADFKLFAGLLLAAYSLISLAGGLRLRLGRQHWSTDAGAGFTGGICGGLASLSGPVMTVWCGLKGWDRDEQRAVYQPYNFAMLLAAFLSFVIAGLVTAEVLWLIAVTLPATLVGVLSGRAVYGRVNDEVFRKIVLWLLSFSALTLVFASLTS